ncbi:hypothetical protein QFZ82_007121 [Streptomyces sp. V4I23]|nr:hypothetical protein [Streptomyces sp. V4I23]
MAALDGVNPAFAWLGADAPASEETNLDWVLGRRVRDSVREARKLLRGYSWTTVCPEELSQRLGGPDALAASGAFHAVFPLRAGRAVLQATRTAAEYTDDAVRRVFEALHPVLPPGMPRFDPAHPDLRYFPADASASAGRRSWRRSEHPHERARSRPGGPGRRGIRARRDGSIAAGPGTALTGSVDHMGNESRRTAPAGQLAPSRRGVHMVRSGMITGPSGWSTWTSCSSVRQPSRS